MIRAPSSRGPSGASRAPVRAAFAGLALVLGLALAACSATSSPGSTATVAPSPTATIGASSPLPSVVPASPVVGVVTRVEASGLAAVSGFTLRTTDGVVLDFAIGTLENGAEFPPGHLAEHQATAEAVRVSFRVEGSRLVAYRIDDASGPPSGAPATTPAPS